MNKQELIEEIKGLKYYNASKSPWVDRGLVLDLVEQLDKHEEGHADEAPRYVKNILARLRELPLHDREVWLKTIMGEFEQDFSRAKWREGYEQGKFEASMIPYEESQKVTVPQFVADWYEERKDDLETALFRCVDIIPRVYEDGELNQFQEWFISGETKPFQTLVNMHQFGYTVKKEPKYTVKIKSVNQYLVRNTDEDFLGFLQSRLKSKFTRKELEEAGLSDVFNSPLFEVEEVEE